MSYDYEKEMKDKYDWLQSLSIGDEVVFQSRYDNRIEKVTKVTPTQIVVGKSRFKKSSGYEIGGSRWSILHLVKPTEEIRGGIEHARLADRLKNMDFKKLSLDRLREIYSVATK